MRPDRGTLVVLDLDPTVGHEQRGVRPAVVVSDQEAARDQRFALLCVVPVTGTPGKGALYPRLSPGRSGLRKPSWALVDHIRSIDKRRVRRVLGKLPASEMHALEEGIAIYLGFLDRLGPGPPDDPSGDAS